jgi:hypothetical protein
MREAGAGHDLFQRHAVKTVAVEEPSSAVDDFLSNFMAVSCGIWHVSLLILLREVSLKGQGLSSKTLS